MLKGDVARLPVPRGEVRTRLVSDLTTLSGLLAIVAIALGGASLVAGLARSTAVATVLGPEVPAAVTEPTVELRVQRFVRGLQEPTAAAAIPGTDAFYVLERPGLVRVARFHDLRPEPALDLTGRVVTDYIEQGLVGIALHPAWESNGRVFLAFVDEAVTLWVAEYRSDPVTFDLDPASERILFSLTHEPGAEYHLGGSMRFGPDGHLWIAVGDGSAPSVGDSFGHGPDPHILQGSLLRIDVGGTDGYTIPASNPFADSVGGAPEVWAYGFRNPWSFDFDSGQIVVADVGESLYEEINVIALDAPGGYYGWSEWEGAACREEPCAPAVAPTVVFAHEEMCALIGGVVYRGDAIPFLQGRFVYADWCSGRLASVSLDDDEDIEDLPVRALQHPSNITVDDDGELYVIQFRRGRILRIAAGSDTP